MPCMDGGLITVAVALIGGIFGGGGLISIYLKYLSQKRTDDRSFSESELTKYKSGWDALQAQINELRINQIPSPSPEWKKDSTRRYVYVSPSYEISILFPLGMNSSDVKGKTDDEIFFSYPDFVSILRSIDDEAQKRSDHIAVRKGVRFPGGDHEKVIIKEIAQGGSGDTYYIGRCYPYHLFE